MVIKREKSNILKEKIFKKWKKKHFIFQYEYDCSFFVKPQLFRILVIK